MPGMFDDLIPQRPAAKPIQSAGMFDDLIPQDPIFFDLPNETRQTIEQRFPIPEQQARPNDIFGDDFNAGFGGTAASQSMTKENIEGQRMRAANLERIRQRNPEQAEYLESLTPEQIDRIAIGRFLNNLGSGVKRLAGLVDDEELQRLQDDSRIYDELVGVQPRAAFTEGLAATPLYVAGGGATAAIKSTAPRVMTGLAVGAAESGIPSLGEGNTKMEAATDAAIGAGLNVAAGEIFNLGKMSPAKQKIKQMIESDPNNKQVVKYYVDGAGRVQTDALAKEAIRQGFDDGVVAVAKGASRLDKSKMRAMLKTLQTGKTNARYAALNRPSDVVGDSLAQRVKYVKNINRQAGSQLDDVAKTLKGKAVDYDPAIKEFLDDLDSLGVKFDSQAAKVSFDGSDIEKSPAAKRVIRDVMDKLRNTRAPDAYDVHRTKRFIDETVTYGKNKAGLGGKAETIVKNLRRNLDQSLDSAFPRYNEVNTRYSETIEALNDYQSAIGKSIDLTSSNSDKALGTVSRRLLSNAQSRVGQLDALNNIESVAKKYGAKLDDDIITQVLFVDELDRIGGAAAKTSLQGDVSKVAERAVRASQQGVVGNTVDAAVDVAKKARGINEENAIEAMRKLLER